MHVTHYRSIVHVFSTIATDARKSCMHADRKKKREKQTETMGTESILVAGGRGAFAFAIA